MSFTRPLAGQSDRGRERESVLRRTRDDVRARAGGRCEWPGCRVRGSDLAHGFRRGNVIGQPLCDHPALCLWLCRSHHDLYDGRAWGMFDAEADEMLTLQWDVVGRASVAFGIFARHTDDTAPVDTLRRLERRLKETGIIRGGQWAG